ncbi:MAG: hypothetical protein P4M15_06555 [Alphaproteobacteria bacterium]|nr:hypothetical protein [Alphaproteobacteria bacterium]
MKAHINPNPIKSQDKALDRCHLPRIARWRTASALAPSCFAACSYVSQSDTGVDMSKALRLVR